MARNYNALYVLTGSIRADRNIIVDLLLPELLYIKMGVLLDDALVAYINHHAMKVPRQFSDNLYGRIEFLRDQARMSTPAEMHRVRSQRNELAHTHNLGIGIDWTRLNEDTEIVHAELKHLNCVDSKPEYKFYCERNPDLTITEPGIAMIHHFVYGVQENGQWRMKAEFTKKFYRHGWDEQKVKEALGRGEQPPSGL